MSKPLRLLGESIQQFAIGLVPAIVMAFACVAIQLALWKVLGFVSEAVFPPEPQTDTLAFLDDPGRYGWRARLTELLQYSAFVSIFFFFHTLVALILTAWLLRRHARFEDLKVLRRALRGAVILTGAAALVSVAASVFGDILPATRDLRLNFGPLSLLALWFALTALLLPARLMGFQPPPGLLKNTVTAAIALVPWLLVSEIVGVRLRNCRECAGPFEGGIVFYPLLAAYLLSLTVASAAVSAAALITASGESSPG